MAALLGVRAAPWLQEARLVVMAASPAVVLGRLEWTRTPMWGEHDYGTISRLCWLTAMRPPGPKPRRYLRGDPAAGAVGCE